MRKKIKKEELWKFESKWLKGHVRHIIQRYLGMQSYDWCTIYRIGVKKIADFRENAWGGGGCTKMH